MLLSLLACDPAFPSPSGTVETGAVGGWSLLRVVAWPATTCNLPPPPDAMSDTFPAQERTAYQLGGRTGTSPHKEWCVAAWATNDREAHTPAAGALYGIRAFEAPPCDMWPLIEPVDYCGFVPNVDLRLDQRAPG